MSLYDNKYLADKLGCDPEYIRQIRKGDRRPGPEKAAVLEKVTGVPRLVWLYPEEYENPYHL